MSKIAIKVENLSKLYDLGEIGTGTISRDMERWFKTKVLKQEDPFLKIGETNDRSNKGTSNIVYSLRELNFEIEQGDAVGIIGRNGAGKSTLLKILSRVTSPSTGRINIKGRVASLLEVGTGFHPELTGLENIYLNGAILGMRKREIDRKLEEIIDFSGVERYIDTPVKRYSSGMYVRLAFAVAAHLESEILIVDEVLAVGDVEFQSKCLGKMDEVSKGEGRTVLFVSHNMTAVEQFCRNSILLENGNVIKHDLTSLVIPLYAKCGILRNGKYIGPANYDREIWFKQISINDCDGDYRNNFNHDEEIHVTFNLGFNVDINKDYTIFCIILDAQANPVFASESEIINTTDLKLKIYPNTLVRGDYSIHSFIHKAKIEQIHVAHDVCGFSVNDNYSKFYLHGEYNYGNVFVDTQWEYSKSN